jgi:hypothetical protein
MRHGQRIFYAALLLSLLTHLIAAGSSGRWWMQPVREISFPIEARLSLVDVPPPPAAAIAPPPEVHHAVTRPSEPAAPAAEEAKVAPPQPAPPALLPMPPVAAPALPPTLPPDPPQPNNPPPPVVSAAAPAPAAALRNLPERIALRYSVQSGEAGFIIGRTTYSGQFRDGHYSLVSVTEATGITSLFISGKIIQTSEGRVTASGLQPELFWGAKGEKKQPPVRFDWAQQRLQLPDGGVELPPQTQDLMSFPFHLAMRVQDDAAAWTLPVTNGKKLREYRFQVFGRERLAYGEGEVETLHLQGSRSGEGSLDVWLAPDRNWLPLRIRTQDPQGKVIVLTLQEPAG